MKFKLEKIGPIKEAEIELGDITLFLGYPSTGKSYALRSIYSTLLPLDSAHEITLKGSIFNSLFNKELWIKGDYILSYLTNAFLIGSCNIQQDLEKIANEVGLQLDVNIKISEYGCEATIKFSEAENVTTLVQRTIRRVKETLKSEVVKALRQSVNYQFGDPTSVVFINDMQFLSFIDNLNISISSEELRKRNNSIVPFYRPSDKGELQIGKKIKYDEEKNVVELDVVAYIKMNNVTTTETQKVSLEANYSPIISDLFSLDSIFNSIVETLRVHTNYSSVAFLPYGKSVLSVVFNPILSPKNLATSLALNIQPLLELLKGVFGNWPPIKESQQLELDWTYRSFIENFNAGKEIIKSGILNDKQKFILDLTTSTSGMKIAVDELNQIYYLLENRALTPLQVSAMVNEISTMLIPLLDLETPSLVFIEEPEAQLHPAYQLVLAVMLLSLVNGGYKFVISTHSDIFAQFIGELVKYKPNKEKILELLKNVLGYIPPTFDEMTERAVNALKEIKLYSYYFKEGKASRKSLDQLIVVTPGISVEVVEKLFDWTFEVSKNEQ